MAKWETAAAASVSREGSQSALALFEEAGFSSRFITRFAKPFWGGISLDPSLSLSAGPALFTLKMFTEGAAIIPEAGMQALPDAIAERHPDALVRLNTPIDSIVIEDGQRHWRGRWWGDDRGVGGRGRDRWTGRQGADRHRVDPDRGRRLHHGLSGRIARSRDRQDAAAERLRLWWGESPGAAFQGRAVVRAAGEASDRGGVAGFARSARTQSRFDRATGPCRSSAHAGAEHRGLGSD